MNRLTLAVAALTGVLAAPPLPASEQDIAALREELAQLKSTYEQRIAALEQRLMAAETAAHAAHARADQSAPAAATAPGQAAKPAASVVAAPAPAPASPASPAPTRAAARGNAFNPEIGLVLQGQYTHAKEVAERSITGYWAAGHDHGDRRGASLEHSELILSASIDPRFRGVARLAVTPDDEVEVEEASISTVGLGHGVSLRAGRFLSDIGYSNAQHGHEWDFADASLMQQVLFGEEGYRHDALQVKWVAPLDFMLMLGAEAGRGENFPGSDRNTNGLDSLAFYTRLGGDLGASHSWQAGLSFLRTRASGRDGHFEDADPLGPNEVEGLFTGRTRTGIVDVVWKWAPEGNARERNLKLQAEFFRRTEQGQLACSSEIASSPCFGEVDLGDLRVRQLGGYAQAVYQFMPRWRVGFRHDWLDDGSKSFRAPLVFGALEADNTYFARYSPRRETLMLDFSYSEFSRLRLQYAHDRAMEGVVDNQWTLQYIMSLGAHGAHRF